MRTLGFGHSDHCAGPEVITTLFEHTGREIRERFGLQPIDADANHGRPRRAQKRQLGMEICVQGDDDLTMVPSTREDGSVVGVGKADVADVFSGQARVAQVKCGGARQALVEERRRGQRPAEGFCRRGKRRRKRAPGEYLRPRAPGTRA